MFFKKFFYKYVLRRKYYRYGKCARCGDCCTKIYICQRKETVKTAEKFEKLKKLHPFYTWLEVIGEDENGLIFKCRNFDCEKHICKIHKIRPSICRRYPSEIILTMRGVMSEKCGYYFKPIDSFAQILQKEKKKRKY